MELIINTQGVLWNPDGEMPVGLRMVWVGPGAGVLGSPGLF